MKHKKIVITGAPGTGKSTVIKQLEVEGYTCMHEISRQIIKEAQRLGTEQLFLTEPLLFSDKLLTGRIEQYKESNQFDNQWVFFDRGIPDVQAYLNYIGMDYPDDFPEKGRVYPYDFIFLMPPWEDIYHNDNERYESFEQALAIHNHLERLYESFGYRVVEVPKGSVESRVEYIINVIKTFM